MNAQGRKILVRVEMRCGRSYLEARESALVALAAGEFAQYRGLRLDQEYWRRALVVVDGLMKFSGESADEQRT